MPRTRHDWPSAATFCEPKYRARALRRALSLGLLLAACRTELKGEVDGQAFVRCAQMDVKERTFQAGALELSLQDRVLAIRAPSSLRVAAFTGPVAGPLAPADLARLAQDAPQLALWLGGLGESEQVARDNLTHLAALRVPTLFVAGGADRQAIVEAAFDGLSDAERGYLVNLSGVRELRWGDQRFVVAAGAVHGRYALDDRACGLASEDLDELKRAGRAAPVARRSYLLSWQAPRGFGSVSPAGQDLGSAELGVLAQTLGVTYALWAFPEPQGATEKGAAVARLGATGTSRADGSRLASGLTRLAWSQDGLSAR